MNVQTLSLYEVVRKNAPQLEYDAYYDVENEARGYLHALETICSAVQKPDLNDIQKFCKDYTLAIKEYGKTRMKKKREERERDACANW